MKNMFLLLIQKAFSTGIGHLVVEAAVLAKEGSTGRDLLKQSESLKPYVRAKLCCGYT